MTRNALKLLAHKFLAAALAAFVGFATPARAQLTLLGVGPGSSGGTPVSYAGPADIAGPPVVWYGTRAVSSAARGTKALNVCNVADVVCADLSTDASTGILVIPAVGGVTCGTTVGVNVCTVKTIYDQSGGNNCSGPCDLTQATIASRAVLTPNCYGALPCLTFAVNQGYQVAGLATFAAPFSISWLANRTGNSTNGYADMFFSQQSGSTCSIQAGYAGAASQTLIYSGNNIAGDATADGFLVPTIGTWNGASSESFTNGRTAPINVTNSGITSLGGNSGIGSTNPAATGCNDFAGNWVETGAWSGAMSSGNKTSLYQNQNTFYATCAQGATFLARVSSPTTAEKASYPQLVCNLVQKSVWSKLDLLYLYAAKDQTTAGLNLPSASYNGTFNGGITFTANSGVLFAANSGWMDTNFNPSTAGGQWAQNSAHIGYYNQLSQSGDRWAGLVDSSGNGTRLDARSDANQYVGNVNDSANPAGCASSAGSVGTTDVSRTGVSTEAVFHNGATVCNPNTTSAALLNGNVYVGGVNKLGTGAQPNDGAIMMAFFHGGGGLTSTELGNLNSALTLYLWTAGF